MRRELATPIVPRASFVAAVSTTAVVLAGLFTPRLAEAAPADRLAVVRFEVSGNVPTALRRTLGERLVEGLSAVSFEVLKASPDAPSPVIDREGEACRDEGCFRRVANALNVSYLVTAVIEERQKTFEIQLELISARTGSVVGTNRERCEICGVVEVGEKMSLAASTLRARLQTLTRAPARIVIRTRPEGAAVKIDGKPMGTTPVDLTLAAGERRLIIERDGYSPLERTLSVTRGVDEALDLDLVQLPTKFPFRGAGWAAVATGAALAAGGIYLLALHGSEVNCKAEERDAFSNCPQVYRTNVVGASLLGGSAVVATLGGVWLYLAQPASGGLLTTSTERASVTRFTGLTVGATGKF